MPQQDTRTPEQESQGQTPEPGSDDEAVNAFEQLSKAESTDEPESGPTDDATEEGADAEPEETSEEGATGEEVEFEGKTYKNVAPELKKALLRQADYSRSMNEVGTQRKEYQQRIETADRLIEGAGKYAEALAEVNAVDARLKAFETINWQQLRQDNPAEFSATASEMQLLRLSREDALKKAQGLERTIQKDREKEMGAKRESMLRTLSKDVPGWGEELGTKVTQYALSSGYSVDEIQGFTDPRLVMALNKARKFDAIQDGKAAIKAKAKDAPPVVKPGAARPRLDKNAEALARLRQTNSLDDAAKAFESRMR